MKFLIALLIIGVILVGGCANEEKEQEVMSQPTTIPLQTPSQTELELQKQKLELEQQKVELEKQKLELEKQKLQQTTMPPPTSPPPTTIAPTSLPPTTPIPTSPPSAKVQDLGDFKVMYTPTKNQYYNELEQIFKELKLFETTAEGLNGVLSLPTDITINHIECGTINAFYDPQTRQIVLCYELTEYIGQLFAPYVESDEELGSVMLDATYFFFFHEMGHGLIDILNLPITGKEEDAVDQLAVSILTETGESGETATLNAATTFLLMSQQTNIENLPFWDEHSLDMQRFYNIICWVYGKNPQKYSYLVDQGLLPSDRALKCDREYEQIFNSWTTLLSPYEK